MKLKQTCLILSLVTTFLFLTSFQPAQSSEEDTIFNKNIYYNIYFKGSDENVSIIESVEILGYQKIMGRVFMIVKAHGSLSLKEEKGYILFEAVTAIIPERNFQIKSKIKQSLHIQH